MIGYAFAGGNAVFNTSPDITLGAGITIATANGILVYRDEDTAVYTKYVEAQRSPRGTLNGFRASGFGFDDVVL